MRKYKIRVKSRKIRSVVPDQFELIEILHAFDSIRKQFVDIWSTDIDDHVPSLHRSRFKVELMPLSHEDNQYLIKVCRSILAVETLKHFTFDVTDTRNTLTQVDEKIEVIKGLSDLFLKIITMLSSPQTNDGHSSFIRKKVVPHIEDWLKRDGNGYDCMIRDIVSVLQSSVCNYQ